MTRCSLSTFALLSLAIASGCAAPSEIVAPRDLADASGGDAQGADPAGPADGDDDANEATDTTSLEPMPPLTDSQPRPGATDVPATAWLILDFAAEPRPESFTSLALDCGGALPIHVEPLGDARILVNPEGPMPAARCSLTWLGPNGKTGVDFTVAPASDPLVIAYDRADPSLIGPFPDDALLVPDPSTATGRRFILPALDRPDGVLVLLDSLAAVLPEPLDGFSPLAPLVFESPAPLDPATLPLTAQDSLDPLTTLALIDLTLDSPRYLERLPFDLVIKREPNADQTDATILLVLPLEPLRAKGRYALVVSRRALATPSRTLAPSAAMSAALADPTTPAGSAAALLRDATPSIRRDDVALLLSVTVRSLDHTGDDLMRIREATLAAPVPEYVIDTIERPTNVSSPIAATLKGRFFPLDWRDGNFLDRDDAGHPRHDGLAEIPFVLALPKDKIRAPLLMYQHGNPGSAEREVPGTARDGFAKAGFAVAGFTDIVNREIANTGNVTNYGAAILQDILVTQRVPDFIALLDTANQLAFIRLLREGLGTLDVLPLDAPDGLPDLDTRAPLGYLGISFGAFRGVGLLPFAPEVHAAALIVGGGRFCSTVIKQESEGREPTRLYDLITSFFPEVTRNEFWIGVALAQMAIDDQDWLIHANHLYGEARYPLAPSDRASVLLVEGLGDSLVPTYSTRGAALAMGLSQFDDIPDPVPGLPFSDLEIRANIDPQTTGAFLQYVAKDVPGFSPTAGCETQPEGHYCAQNAVIPVMLRYFADALTGVPAVTP
jgi:hypothetical protein